ncbi:MAG: polyphosphate polymerase domain-containing protein [Mangrovibacterium sp.]
MTDNKQQINSVSSPSPLGELEGAFSPISLAEMEGVRLMNRTDTKYVTNAACLQQLMAQLSADYYMQEINHSALNPYETIYMDTPNCDMFLTHHSGKAQREKVRTRKYVDADLCFLEVKNKNNKGVTRKKRVELMTAEDISLEGEELLDKYSSFQLQELTPHVETTYERITLVNRAKTERLTIDVNLGFKNLRTGITKQLPDLVIIELKQQQGDHHSKAKALLNDLRLRPTGMSKYCIGAALTNPDLKQNRFKMKLKQLDKLINRNGISR